MTNTLHRRGTPAGLECDFVIFAITAGGINREGSADRMKAFSRIVLKHNPANFGDMEHGNLFSKDPDQIIAEMTDSSHPRAVFTNIEAISRVLVDLKEADLGVSINISGLVDDVTACCKETGIAPHSVEQSLGIRGQTEKLPNDRSLELNSMCGHGMVSFNLIQKVIELVKLGKLTPEEGARHLTKPCECAAFNPHKARLILEEVKKVG